MGLVFYPWKAAEGAAASGSSDRKMKTQASQGRAGMQPPVPDPARTEADQTRVLAALSRLQLASDLIDQAGCGLAPFVPGACSEALLELSLELARVEAMLGRHALGYAARRTGIRRKATD